MTGIQPNPTMCPDCGDPVLRAPCKHGFDCDVHALEVAPEYHGAYVLKEVTADLRPGLRPHLPDGWLYIGLRRVDHGNPRWPTGEHGLPWHYESCLAAKRTWAHIGEAT